jgi:membrane fusion protein (multidrug efflux system)
MTSQEDHPMSQNHAAAQAAPASKSPRKTLFGALAAAIIVAGGAYYAFDELYASKRVSTDNAYVGANVAQVTPLVGGPIAEVLVEDAQTVRKGDVLVRLDDTDARLTFARAEAALSAAERQVRGIVATGDDHPDVAAARAARDQAKVDLERTVIRAPVDGIISRRQVQVGQRVQPGPC